MNRTHRGGAIALAAVAFALTFSLTACGGTPIASSTPATSDILTRTLPPDVSPQGVLTAAVLLKIANIEGAIQQGLVTPAEVAEARKALEEGTLDLWKQRAEAQ